MMMRDYIGASSAWLAVMLLLVGCGGAVDTGAGEEATPPLAGEASATRDAMPTEGAPPATADLPPTPEPATPEATSQPTSAPPTSEPTAPPASATPDAPEPTTTPEIAEATPTPRTEAPATATPDAGSSGAEPTIEERAIALVAQEKGIPASELRVVRVEGREWRNSSLGCPEPGGAYLDVLTEGARITIEGNGETFYVHTNRRNIMFICEYPEEIGPSPDT